MAATQQNRLLSLSTPLAYDHLLIKRLRAYEAISQLFQYEIEALHEETDAGASPTVIDPQRVIGQPMVVHAKQLDGASRYFHGICTRFVQGTRNERFTKYQIIVRPRVWLLTQIHQSRIFQQKSVPDILRTVLEGIDVKFELQGTYQPRNYCVQYRETDWNFVARLMEEEGIYFFFEHGEQMHRMIIADTPQSNVKLPGKTKIPFRLDISSNLEEWQGSITAFRLENSLNTGKVTLWDHNFELPGKRLETVQVSRFTIGGNQQLEHYDFPGEYAKRFDGIAPGGGEQSDELSKIFDDNKRTVSLRQQEIDVEYKDGFGTSDCCALTPGYRFELEKYSIAAENGDHLLVSVRTDAIQSPSYFSDEEVENAYQCQFVALPYSTPFRPARRTRKPLVRGSQTATVVGPAGEEIFTDKYGRVKVQFHWDRDGRADATSSCWLRVAQTWAGKQWGTMFIPRVGQEVIVDFLEGDPDKPIIIGSVYNPENMPPYTLPNEKTKSTIKTNSSKGGGGFNEIRFEDKKGSEQIFIHAEKDADIRVKNDCMETIEHDRHLTIEHNQIEKVSGDKSLTVSGNQVEKVDGNVHLKVGTNKESKIGSKYAVDAGQEIHLKSGLTATIEAGTNLTLKVGGNFININPGGVFIKGIMVMLNSGGAAGSGSGANPNPPSAPKAADKDKAGSVSSPLSPPPPKQPRVFAQLAQIVREHLANPQSPSLESVLAEATSTVESSINQARKEAESVATAVESQIAAVQNAAQNLVNEAENLRRDLEENAKSYADQAMQMAQDLKRQAEDALNQAVQAIQDAVEQIQQAVENAIAQVQEAINNAIDQAMQALSEVQQAVQQGIEQAQQAIQDAVNQVQDAVQQAVDQAQQAINEAQQAVEQAIQQAQEAVEQVQQQVEQAIQQAQESIQQAAEEVQQQVQQAVAQAQEAVQQGIEQAQQAVEQIQQQAEQAIEQAEQAVEQVQQQAEQAVKQVQQQADQAIEQAQQTLEQAQQQAEQAMQQAQQQAEQAINEAQQAAEQGIEQAQQAAGQAAEQVQQAAGQVQVAAEEISQSAGQALQSAQNGLPFI
ncbi:MAG: hypothetical protein C4324_06430 [Blastocatellia bacterium]